MNIKALKLLKIESNKTLFLSKIASFPPRLVVEQLL